MTFRSPDFSVKAHAEAKDIGKNEVSGLVHAANGLAFQADPGTKYRDIPHAIAHNLPNPTRQCFKLRHDRSTCRAPAPPRNNLPAPAASIGHGRPSGLSIVYTA
jgi:hypothetical protein